MIQPHKKESKKSKKVYIYVCAFVMCTIIYPEQCSINCLSTESKQEQFTFSRAWRYRSLRGSSSDAVANVQACNVVVSEIEFGRYYVLFQKNNFRKGINPLFPIDWIVLMFFNKDDFRIR